MIRLVEFDLAAPEPLLPLSRPTWVLVRQGSRVLGRERFGPLGPLEAEQMTDVLVRKYAARASTLTRLEQPAASEAGTVSIAVVVCTRDRPDYLRTCLERLTTLDPPPAELLVVDNAPTDARTQQVCEEFGVRRVLEPRPGLDRARDRGWQATRSDVVAFVDDDAVAGRGFAGTLAQSFTPGVAAVTGLVLPLEVETHAQRHFELVHGGMRKGFRRTVFRRETVREPLEAFQFGVGTNMAFRREILGEIGGFDPRLDVGTATRGGGDLDALYRVIAAGHVIRYEPDVVVYHLHRADRRGLLRQFRDYGTSFSALLALRESAADHDAARVRAYRRRWHIDRHLVGVARAMARRDRLGALCLLAEARGSLGGRAALARETALSARRPPSGEAE